MSRFVWSGFFEAVGREHFFVSIHDAVDYCLEEMDLPEVFPEDAAYVFFTSGTTGVPKIAPHTHNSYLCKAEYSARASEFRGDGLYHFQPRRVDAIVIGDQNAHGPPLPFLPWC